MFPFRFPASFEAVVALEVYAQQQGCVVSLDRDAQDRCVGVQIDNTNGERRMGFVLFDQQVTPNRELFRIADTAGGRPPDQPPVEPGEVRYIATPRAIRNTERYNLAQFTV